MSATEYFCSPEFCALGASILRGVGRQNVGTIITFVGFYIVCIPVGVGLGFGFHQGVFGLWWGAAAGIAATTVGYYVFIYGVVDWKEEEKNAYERVSSETTGLVDELALNNSDEEDGLSLASESEEISLTNLDKLTEDVQS